MTQTTKRQIRVLKNGIKVDGKYIRCHYSAGGYVDGTGITVYAKCILDRLPVELMPKNDSDGREDYFETASAIIREDNELYNDFLKYC